MGAIIRMESKKFFKDFLPEVNQKDYQFIVISEFIKTNGKSPNVKAIQRLMPPAKVLSEFIDGNKKAYKKAYLNYLQNPQIESFLSIIVKAAVINDMNIVLICSHSENEFKYLKYICEYIETVFKLKTYTWADFNTDPEKARKIKNKDEVAQILNKKFEKMQKLGVNLETNVDKEKVVKQLKELGKKGMKKIAKAKGIKLDEDLSKDKMAKKLAKKLLA